MVRIVYCGCRENASGASRPTGILRLSSASNRRILPIDVKLVKITLAPPPQIAAEVTEIGKISAVMHVSDNLFMGNCK